MFTYTGTTCPKCGKPHTIPTIWMSVTPPPVSCGCNTNILINNTTK